MLSRLLINNYALIKSLEMMPDAGLNIITGETGAGKSIMLGAVGLLLGNRADTKVLYDLDQKCIIEGEFDISQYNLGPIFKSLDLDFELNTLIRREITPSGKSRAFVNDTPVTLEVLKELGNQLMDVHSQHQTLRIGSANYQLAIIDVYAHTKDDLDAYQNSYHDYKAAKNKLDELTANADRIKQESDFNEFLLNELVEMNLVANEQPLLEEELKMLEHAEEIKTNLNNILLLLDQNEQNSLSALHDARTLIKQIDTFGESLDNISQRINSAYIELADIVSEISYAEQALEVDLNRTEEVRERLSQLYHLQNKHHVKDISGLLEIQQKLEEETFIAHHLDAQIAAAKKQLSKTQAEMITLGNVLSKKRQNAFKPFEKEIVVLLQQLGMPEAKLLVNNKSKLPADYGLDEISIDFSANKGVTPAPLSKVASGGEFSRLMFCIKYVMADKTALPTIVFDEIDSGISGEIALKMGNMMKQMATNHQVITISHLPQIAAKGQSHYFVYKDVEADRAISLVRKLSANEKVEEIAKMIGGDRPSEHAYESAKELILS